MGYLLVTAAIIVAVVVLGLLLALFRDDSVTDLPEDPDAADSPWILHGPKSDPLE